MKVKLSGFRELDAALGQLPKATGRNVLRRTGIAALTPIVEDAADRAPEFRRDLKDSVSVSTRRPRRHRRQDEVEVFAGPTNLPQAHLQEFGTRHHGPQPFMRPAWDAGKRQVLDDVKTALADQIGKAAARLARKAARLAKTGA